MFTYSAIAADKGTLTIPTTAVTGNPLGVGSDQMVVPISILSGRELSLKRENTLAETLNSIPGASNSSFGPSVGRPMIRGMDSDRIKILQNGVNNLDASNLSFDGAGKSLCSALSRKGTNFTPIPSVAALQHPLLWAQTCRSLRSPRRSGMGRKQTCQPVQLWGASHKSSLEPDA